MAVISSLCLKVARGDVGNPYVSQHGPKQRFSKGKCHILPGHKTYSPLFQWLLVPEGDSLYTIRNSGTGLYLTVPSTKLVKGARLTGQSVANGETPFQWKIETFGPGVMFL
jgi:hypothetical protein